MRYLSQHARVALTLGAAALFAACAKGEDTAAGDSASAATATTPTDSLANPAMPSGSTTGAMTGKTDADYMAALSATNGGEIAAGKLAQTKATDAEVKAFAKMLVDDHMAMSKQGDSLAMKLGAPHAMPGDKAGDAANKANDVAGDLEGKTGKDFDKAFMSGQVDAHQKALDTLNEIANSSSANAELKTLAQGAIPKVQAHLERARTLKDKLDR